MNEAQRKAQLRRQRILERSADRLLVATGEVANLKVNEPSTVTKNDVDKQQPGTVEVGTSSSDDIDMYLRTSGKDDVGKISPTNDARVVGPALSSTLPPSLTPLHKTDAADTIGTNDEEDDIERTVNNLIRQSGNNIYAAPVNNKNINADIRRNIDSNGMNEMLLRALMSGEGTTHSNSRMDDMQNQLLQQLMNQGAGGGAGGPTNPFLNVNAAMNGKIYSIYHLTSCYICILI